jgi:hypothetical protein
MDAAGYAKGDIAELYHYRWLAELDIRAIKQTLGLDHLRCKTPEMVRRELWVTLLAYNLIPRGRVPTCARCIPPCWHTSPPMKWPTVQDGSNLAS